MRRSRIDALIGEGRRAARRLKELQTNMDGFLATVQIGVTLMGTLAGVAGGYLASLHIEPFIARSWLAEWVSPPLAAALVVGAGIVYVELILGELVPKALALRYPETVALLVAHPLSLMSRVARGLVVLLSASTRAFLAVFRIRGAG